MDTQPIISAVNNGFCATNHTLGGLDRSLTNTMRHDTNSIMSAADRINDKNVLLNDAHFAGLQNQGLRSYDSLLSDGRRNTDQLLQNTDKNAYFGLNDSRRNFDQVSAQANRNTDNIIKTGYQTAQFGLNDSRRNFDQGALQVNRLNDNIINDVNRNTDFLLGDSRRNFDNINSNANKNTDSVINDVNRTSDFMLSDSRRCQENMLNTIYRGTDSVNNNIQLTSTSALLATERNGTAGILATERVGSQTALATQNASAEAVRNTMYVRDLVNSVGIESRADMHNIQNSQLIAGKESALLTRDSDLRNADNFAKTQMLTKDSEIQILKSQREIEKQASDNAAALSKEIAAVATSVLISKGEVMRQASEIHGDLKYAGLQHKDSISHQVSKQAFGLSDKLSAQTLGLSEKVNAQTQGLSEKMSYLNTNNIRDDRNSFRSEGFLTQQELFNGGYGHHGRHGYYGRGHGFFGGDDGYDDDNYFEGRGRLREPVVRINTSSRAYNRNVGRDASRSRSRSRSRSSSPRSNRS